MVTLYLNSFNEYFVNVGRLLSEDIDCDTNSLHYVQNNLNSMCIHEITTAEIMTVISTLNNSATMHDGIPAFIMKQCINDYITPLTHLINLSINEWLTQLASQYLLLVLLYVQA